MQLLVDGGASIYARNHDGSNALMVAASQGHELAVEFLIGHGADVNMQSKPGWTALMYVVYEGHAHTVKCLILAGAAINPCDIIYRDHYDMPLTCAVQNGNSKTWC